MTLTPYQIEEFRQQGVLRVTGVFSSADLQSVIDEVAEFIDRRAVELSAEGKVTDLHRDEPFARRYALLYAQSQEMGKGLDIMQQLGPRMFEFLFHPGLLDVLQALLGPDLTCNPIQHLRAKPPDEFEPHTGPSFHMAPWHQDAAVMMPEARPRFSGDPRPESTPSSWAASVKPMEMPAPTEADRPTRKVCQVSCVAKAAAKIGASVDTEPSIKPARPGWT